MTRCPKTIKDIPKEEFQSLPLSADHWKAIFEAVSLSPRQVQVALRLLRGLRCKEIATEMNIKETTVREYLSRISVQTRTHGRMEFVMRLLAVSHEVNPRHHRPTESGQSLND
jgi:DNA-binding NarL/FixJ family response regulator